MLVDMMYINHVIGSLVSFIMVHLGEVFLSKMHLASCSLTVVLAASIVLLMYGLLCYVTVITSIHMLTSQAI